jgi:hypothetical protein
MKRIILFSLLALTACKKEEIKPQPLPAKTSHTFEVKGLNVGLSQVLWYIDNNNVAVADSVWSVKQIKFTIQNNDSVVITHNVQQNVHIQIFIDDKLYLDTIPFNVMSYSWFKYTYKNK